MRKQLQCILMGTMAFLPVVGEAAGQSNQNQNQRSIASPAQNQNPSLADLARRERALHKNQPQTDMVWSNDNLPEAGGISVVGPPAQRRRMPRLHQKMKAPETKIPKAQRLLGPARPINWGRRSSASKTPSSGWPACGLI